MQPSLASGATPAAADELAALREVARRIRVETIRAVMHAKGGHVGGPLSAADLLAALYCRVLRIRPAEPGWPERDRFILSKGHSSIALYAAMALRGFFPVAELATFDGIDSRLQGHPDMTRLPGLDMSTGSLGMGLSAGVGMAIGAKRLGRALRVFVLLGDGECQEGEVWEAAFIAERYRLDNLVAVIDFNKLQQYGWPAGEPGVRLPPWQAEELTDKWRAFGWAVAEIDGHEMAEIVGTLERLPLEAGRPSAILAHTVKGRGVSFMEGRFTWHTRVPTTEEFAAAMAELGEPA